MATRLGMRVEFQRCRVYRHAWEDFIPAQGTKRPAPWGRRFSLRCVRCGTERHDIIDSRGDVSSREYAYPDEYSLPAEETPTLQQFRLSLIAENRALASARAERINGRKPAPRRDVRKRSLANVS